MLHPNGFTIRNIKDYDDYYIHMKFYSEGIRRIEEIYLEDKSGNILSTSKPITSDFFIMIIIDFYIYLLDS